MNSSLKYFMEIQVLRIIYIKYILCTFVYMDLLILDPTHCWNGAQSFLQETAQVQ